MHQKNVVYIPQADGEVVFVKMLANNYHITSPDVLVSDEDAL